MTNTSLIAHEFGSLVLGLRDGQIVGIDDVESGLACNCVCPNPACGARLVAKKCKAKADHFAHYRAEACRAALESALHLMAKQALEEALEFRLPAYSENIAGSETVISEERVLSFDAARLEKRTGRIVPDVILEKDGHFLLVELVVTHWCGQEKIDLLKLGDLPCVEVDLSPWKNVPVGKSLKEIVVSEASRAWLNNPRGSLKASKVRAEVESQIEAQAKAKAAHAQAIAGRYRAALASKVKEQSVENTVPFYEYGLGKASTMEVAGEACFAGAHEWKRRLLSDLVLGAHLNSARWGGFATKAAFELVKPLIRPGVPTWVEEADREDIKAIMPEFKTPYEVVGDYLHMLRVKDILDYRGRWYPSQSTIYNIEAADRRVRAVTRRTKELKGLVREILDALPPKEGSNFSFGKWLDEEIFEGITVKDAIERERDTMETVNGAQDSKPFQVLLRATQAVRDMLTYKKSVPSEFLGLPVHAAAERINQALESELEELKRRREYERREAERLRLEKEARDEHERRQAELQAYSRRHKATEVLFNNDLPIEKFGDLRRNLIIEDEKAWDLAIASDEGFQRVKFYLERLRQNKAPQFQKSILWMMCNATHNPERAQKFLKTWNPSFGANPIDTCFDSELSSRLTRLLREAGA